MKNTLFTFSVILCILGCTSTEPDEYVPMAGSEDYIYTFALHNDYLYASSVSKLNIYSLSDPENPVKVKEADLYGSRNLSIMGNDLYISRSATTVYSLATMPENPAYKSNVNVSECDVIASNETHAYTVTKANTICSATVQNDHFAIFDLINPPHGIPIQHGQMGEINALALYGNYLFASGKDSLTIYDITNPVAMHAVKTVNNVMADQLIIRGNTLLAFSNSQVKQFSIDPANIQNISLISTYTL
ncbi:hypothetical protein [Chryseobacterium sp.]|uniref:hypothetical protein n=1 Tax=Chryseobacterium sp. TaxID=1871047 RepID=UPI00289F6794|nr:hypothetical protein [Chryseobacterium sp.]